eukprot:Skav236177  [mRNA]  locus=scaffold3799:27262:28191:- [translate_table: standard]
MLELYKALGNHVADRAATEACAHLLPDFVANLADHHRTLTEQSEHLYHVYQLHLDVAAARKRAMPPPATASAGSPQQEVDIRDAFANWTVVSSWTMPAVTCTFHDSTVCGTDFAASLVNWCGELQWPSDFQGPLQQETGVTWVELALSFMLSQGTYLPIVRLDRHGHKRLLVPHSFDSAREWGFSALEAGGAMQRFFDNVASMTPETLVADNTRGKCYALYLQGARKRLQGWRRRPRFPAQAAVIDMLATQIRAGATEGRGDLLSWTPKLETLNNGLDVFFEGTLDDRQRCAFLRRSQVRNMRRALGLR